jgi:hypothetical protein
MALFVLFFSLSAFSQPTIPIQWFYFPSPGFFTTDGSAPIASSTNLLSVPVDLFGGDNALILDTTNSDPAYLEYAVTDTNGIQNFSYDPGTVLIFFSPNWSSVSQGGTGPGTTAYLIGSGDWSTGSPNGLFTIYADSVGSNIYVSGVGDGVTNIYASAPISWTSNTFHQIGVEWSSSGSRFHPGIKLYLDGALAATGVKLSIVPATGYDSNGFSTNGVFVGSDNNGAEQMRGAIWDMTTWGVMYGGWYTNGWTELSNAIVAWQGTLTASGFGGMMTMGMSSTFSTIMSSIGAGNLTPVGSSGACVIGTNVYITNMSSMTDTNGDGGMTFIFTIEGGTNGALYDVFSTSNVMGSGIANSSWTWLGQGTNCGIYQITNQPSPPLLLVWGEPPSAQSFYILGTPQLASDGSGFTAAYESLVMQTTNAFATNSGSPGIPLGWAFSLGLTPNGNYIGNSGQRINYTYDPVGRLSAVTGIRNEITTNDPEGNVLQIAP